MINAQVVSEYNLWKKNIINPEIYFKKKLKKLTKFKPFNFSSKTFTILLTSNNKMKYLNNKFRKKNKPTDVLSFPFYNMTELKKKKDKIKYLGDIAISYQFVKNRSKLTNFELELDKLWLHGYLHLLGYDHKKNNDYYEMRSIENKILKFIQK